MSKQTAGNNKFLATMKAWYTRNSPTGKMTVQGKNNYSSLVDLVNRTSEANAIESALRHVYHRRDELEAKLIEAGVIAAPANSEPQADITPADYAAVEAMGEVAANVFGEDDICDCGKPIYPRSGMCPACFSAWLHTVPAIDTDTTPNVLDVPASDEISKQDAQPEGAVCPKCNGAKKVVYIEAVIDCPKCDGTGFVDAQTAPVDGGSDEPLRVTIMNQLSAKIEDGDEHAFTCTCGAYFVEGTGELCGDCVSKLQAEIRALREQLAAAGAALEAIANLHPYKMSQSLNETWAVGYNRGIGKAQEIANEALAKLAAPQQSGAGEGK